MGDHCLIVTHLDLSERYKLQSGVQRRLSMLVERTRLTARADRRR